MLFYQLAVQKFIQYFKIGDLSENEKLRRRLLKMQPKKIIKTEFKTDATLSFYISIILSVICTIMCCSVPFIALDDPCRIFIEKKYFTVFKIAKIIEEYFMAVDMVVVFLLLLLVYTTVKLLYGGVKNSMINISPWIEQGKYEDPKTIKKKPYVRMVSPEEVEFYFMTRPIRRRPAPIYRRRDSF